MGSLLAVMLLIWLVRVPILRAIGGVLTTDEPLRKADLIFPLGGHPNTRPFFAARLYRDGYAPRVVLVQVEQDSVSRTLGWPSETETTLEILAARGVPRDSVLMLDFAGGGVASTFDEAVRLRDYLRDKPGTSVIVVTNSYHTRRARWTLERALGDLPVTIIMAGAPHPEFDETNWWRSEIGMILVFEEYVKFFHTWMNR